MRTPSGSLHSALDDDGCFMRSAPLQKDGDEPVFSETEKSAVRRQLKLLTYTLLLLESEGEWRARIQELADLNPYRTGDAVVAFVPRAGGEGGCALLGWGEAPLDSGGRRRGDERCPVLSDGS